MRPNIDEAGGWEPQVHDNVSRSIPISRTNFERTTRNELPMLGPEGHLPTDYEKSPVSGEAELNPGKAAEFTFVQVENKRGPRTAARSHVMREFWREKRLQKVQKPGATRKRELYNSKPKNSKRGALRDVDCCQSISGNTRDNLGSDINTREVDEATNREAPRTKLAQPKLEEPPNPGTLPERFSKYIQTMVPLSRTGIADVDPFSRLNVGEGPEIQKLLHHYCWITASCMDREAASTDFRRVGWLFSKVVWLDPTPGHVFMGFTIHHIARLHGQKEPPIAIKHKMEGMRAINERLDDPAEALSDGNIGAVANFTSHELLSGNPEDFSIHMNGLDQMVKCRGGLAAFSGNRPLQLVVESLDLCRAYIRISRPTYSMYDANSTENLTKTSSLGTSTIQYEVAKMQARNEFCADFIRMVDGLEKATAVVKDAASKIISQEQWNKFSDRIFSAAIGMSWLHPTEQVIDERRNSIWRCFRLASLVYLQVALHDLFTTAQPKGQDFQACKCLLLDTTTDWGRAIEMLARVILRGERSKTERHRRAWYVANAMIELQDFALETWRMAESTLFSYLGSLPGKIEGGSSRPPTMALSSSLDICSGYYNSDGGKGGLELFCD
ncbi:hypothetical protein EYC84_008255 [Monilinia fructicola]|uniref:Uncharacterized protein n=1 Tax=Monilinia fructicola TaxID=38448 RepID=A0A5M9JDY5_MONFR|nr:hypothetical protein EYC84_008255 [Monilinia fructicola]